MMKSSTPIRQLGKQIDIIVKEKMVNIGFVEKEKYIFSKLIIKDVEGFVIVEKTDHGSRYNWSISPTVGIINHKVEDIYYKLVDNIDFSKELLRTATSSIGYILPENSFKAWDVNLDDTEDQIHEIIDDLILQIKKYILPFFMKMSQNKELQVSLEKNSWGITSLNYFKVPILYYINEEKEKGLKYIEDILAKIRPTPKVNDLVEPEFNNLEEVKNFFSRDKDILLYWEFVKFRKKFIDLKN
ncbi:MAG: hypothetical protein CR989_03065 [Flavobacteriales bacterium]|nr:MAG: hypothetical protein CR989_03065 [Flavobacteriales bacterium]